MMTGRDAGLSLFLVLQSYLSGPRPSLVPRPLPLSRAATAGRPAPSRGGYSPHAQAGDGVVQTQRWALGPSEHPAGQQLTGLPPSTEHPIMCTKWSPRSEVQDRPPPRRRGRGSACPSKGLQRAARGLAGPGQAVGRQASRMTRAEGVHSCQNGSHRQNGSFERPHSGPPLDPCHLWRTYHGQGCLGCFGEATMAGTIDWLYHRKG